jgi:hypothetical protein
MKLQFETGCAQKRIEFGIYGINTLNTNKRAIEIWWIIVYIYAQTGI